MPGNVQYWAVSGRSFRAITTPDDLLHGEKLAEGDQPQFPPDYAAGATDKKAELMTEAATVISLLQDAVDLGMATDDETERYNAWRKYRVLLSRVDITVELPEWPEQPT